MVLQGNESVVGHTDVRWSVLQACMKIGFWYWGQKLDMQHVE